MATLLHSESRRLYSWWWDSHISPKNSKWLQENLTDMDAKVKSMIKLIEEDADSFARRAEMYYKKRPELMKLVEEFYRAYRALAERYDHATGELRLAHRTIAEAFPNHVPYALTDDLPSGSSGSDVEPHTPEMPHPLCAFFDPDELQKDVECLSINSFPSGSEESGFGIGRKGLKQLNEMFGLAGPDQNVNTSGETKKGMNVGRGDESELYVPNGTSQLSSENQNVKAQVLAESENVGKAESELQNLKKILEAIRTEKEALFHQYDQSLKKLSTLESKLSEAQKDASLCNDRASHAETEIKILKEALIKLERERDACLLQYNQFMERISDLEHALFQAQEDAKGLHNRALKAETEVESLKNKLLILASEKETGLLQYKHCLDMISALENKIALAEENSRTLTDQNERAEIEVKELKEALANLRDEKDAAGYLYKQCLETISKMEYELSCAQENAKQLDGEILDSAAKLKGMEEQHLMLESSNQCLQIEADSLMQKIAVKDQELLKKQKELEVIQITLQQEQSQFYQVEATLLSLQKLHSQSKEEQRALTLELKNSLQRLKELEACNHDLKEGMGRVKVENQSLNEVNMSSATSIKNLQDEVISLKELKEKIEKELSQQMDRSNALQQEVDRFNEEIDVLDKAYQALLQQVRSAGLNPQCIEANVRQLQEENSYLKEACGKHMVEKETLFTKLGNMDNLIEQNANLRCSLSELNGKLEGSTEMIQELHKFFQLIQGEKSTLVVEKATILSQLQSMKENMQNLLEKNTLLETSLSGANIELEGLREKSRSLEEMCQLLKNEKSNLEKERSTLVFQLQNIEQRLCNLEKRFTKMEEKYAELEKEKDSTDSQLKKLQGFFHEERQLHACYAQSSESRFTVLESHVHVLQEENRLREKDFEEELDKAVKVQVEIFILQNFIKDLEEKNLSMVIECQKHVEASKLSDKLIKELESENLEQQIETEFLLDELQKLRVGIHQVFWALQFDQENRQEEIIKPDQISLPYILESVEDLKSSLSRDREEKQKLLLENSVLLASLGQLKLDGTELELEKEALEQKFMIVKEQNAMLQEVKQKMLEMNQLLTLEVSAKKQQEEVLFAELESYRVKLADMKDANLVLQEENSKQLDENRLMLKKFLDLKDEMHVLEEENSSALHEAVALGSLSLVLESFSTEKIAEVKTLAENLGSLQMINRDLMEKMDKLGSELECKEAENIHLNEIVEKLHNELYAAKDLNEELNYEIVIGKDFLQQKAVELVEFEQNLQSAHNLNSELCGTLEEMKREFEKSKQIRVNLEMQVHEFSQANRQQEREVKHLQEINGILVSEVSILQKENEEKRMREENLSLELQDRSNEFEIWEAEAASFYFDFQISAIHEVLLENKVHELTDACKSLEEESTAKDVQIKEMISRIDHLESEVGGLQSQLSSYVLAIASLKDSIASLKKNAHAQTRLSIPGNQSKLGFEISCVLGGMDSKDMKDQSSIGTTGIADLQEIQKRLKEVEEAIKEEANNLSWHQRMDGGVNIEPSASCPEPELRNTSDQGKNKKNEEREQRDERFQNHHKSKMMKPEISELRTATLLKDIPLDQGSDSQFYGSSKREKGSSDDQMLELWESAEQDCGTGLAADNIKNRSIQAIQNASASHLLKDAQQKNSDLASGIQAENEVAVDKLEVPTNTRQPKRGATSRNTLERLVSDAQKLTSLQSTVQELRKKVEMNKRSKRTSDHEYRRVKGQLQEVAVAIAELVNMNGQLTWEIEESPSSIDMECSDEPEEAGSTQRKSVTEQAQKESEKIERLQFEVQSIQHILLKLEDERKNKGKTKFAGSKTSALLKDLVQQGGKKKKKACLCGCVRPSTKED